MELQRSGPITQKPGTDFQSREARAHPSGRRVWLRSWTAVVSPGDGVDDGRFFRAGESLRNPDPCLLGHRPYMLFAPATGAFGLEDPNQTVFRVFWRKSLTEPKNLGITISGTGEMGTADREVMSIMLPGQHVHGLQSQGVVNQDLSFIPLGQ